MIDLTPLDVRKKRGDFARGVRGYSTQEVDTFLELVAERLEELVKENLTLRERVDRLAEQVTAQTGRERAVHEALVTAQQLRDEIHSGAQKEAELVIREARSQAREIVAEAERAAVGRSEAIHELERRRKRFLGSFRQFLERELDAITVEEGREPIQEAAPIDLDLGARRPTALDPRASDDVHALAADAEAMGAGPTEDVPREDQDPGEGGPTAAPPGTGDPGPRESRLRPNFPGASRTGD